MPERATTETNEYVPLKTLEELLANRIGWSNSAISPFAVDCRNRQNIRMKQIPAHLVLPLPEVLRLAG